MFQHQILARLFTSQLSALKVQSPERRFVRFVAAVRQRWVAQEFEGFSIGTCAI